MKETSGDIHFEATNTYTKGNLFCCSLGDGRYLKYPLANIWSITEKHNYQPAEESK
jgi:hypothetical protein